MAGIYRTGPVTSGRLAGQRSSATPSASTEENIGSVPEAQEADVDAAVAAARRAFDDPDGWRP